MPIKPSLIVDKELVLKPLDLECLKDMIDAFNEGPESAFAAAPWLEKERDVKPQFVEFLLEVLPLTDIGEIFHWKIIEIPSGNFIGLIGLDKVTQTAIGYWNMGFWIRPKMQRKKVVSRSIDCILSWLKENRDFRIVEMTVSSENVASRNTVKSAIKRWNMDNINFHETFLPIRNKSVKHETYLFDLRVD
tara:strand:+ start:189 stop:758 length:570 start_codon:yes stop_codon:yes gene_type:complete